MTKIGIDARLYREAGVGRYIRNLLANLQKIDSKNEYYIFLLSKDMDIKLALNFHKVEADFGWYGLAEQIKYPKLLKRFKLDLVHFPHFNIPIFYRGKFVVTIHDLIHQHYKMRRSTTRDPLTYAIKHQAYNLAFRVAVKNSQKVITVSDFIKGQLEKEAGIDVRKIVVTKEAVEERLVALGAKQTESGRQKVLAKFGIKAPFIFYVGNAHPHKNVEGLIKAFLNLKSKISNLKLVLAGQDHYFWQRLQKTYQDQSIIYTGFVSDEELVALYKSAEVFVMPSFEEGFGIPLLEAMACGCPVASSNLGSLPEVGGDAGIYFDPNNSEDMAEEIEMVLSDDELRKKLIDRGFHRVKQFSWKKLAEETLKIYEGAA